MKESLQDGAPGGRRPEATDPFMDGTLEKPVIAAINGFAMGGGFMLVERTDLRIAARGAVFEVSEAKRWLLGGYNHGHIANLPYPIAMEMALGFRFTAERFYEVGFVNRLVDPDALMPTAFEMAQHLLTLPPASRVNTVHMMRQMRPSVGPELERLAGRPLHDHGAKSDPMDVARGVCRKAPGTVQGMGSTRRPLPPAQACPATGVISGDRNQIVPAHGRARRSGARYEPEPQGPPSRRESCRRLLHGAGRHGAIYADGRSRRRGDQDRNNARRVQATRPAGRPFCRVCPAPISKRTIVA